MNDLSRESKVIQYNNTSSLARPYTELSPTESGNEPGLEVVRSQHENQGLFSGTQNPNNTGEQSKRKRSAQASVSRTARMEHRHGKRYKTLVYVDIRCRDAVTVPGIMYNISTNGMFVLCSKMPKVHESVDIAFPFFDEQEVKMFIPGFVIHSNSHGFGMMFRELDNSRQKVIEKLIRR